MKVFRALVPWCLGVFVLCSETLGQTAATGALQGRIAKASSGDPLGGVQITLIPLVENAPPSPPSERRLVVSDNSGGFSFKDLRPGDYLLETQFEGYFLSSSKPVLTKISAVRTTNVSLAMTPGAVRS